MAKNVLFKNEVCDGFYEEKERSEDLFAINPSVFHNERDDDAKIALCDPFGFIYVEGEEKPYYFMRHALVDMYRFGGVIELGDGPLDPQKSGDCDDFFQKGGSAMYILKGKMLTVKNSFMVSEQKNLIQNIVFIKTMLLSPKVRMYWISMLNSWLMQ